MSRYRLRVRCLLPVAVALAHAYGAVPTPESHFGHAMGVDRKLLDWSNVVSYFQALSKSSDRLRFYDLGKSTEGRPFVAAIISSPATLRDLDHYRDIQQRLADPRALTTADAERLIRDGKTVVMITCSIHATEVASTSTAVEFAYKLLTEENPKFRAILDNVILILVPSLNPDGVDIVTDWYRKTLGTPYEGTSPPRLYHKYVGHDNNRDWYIFSQVETQLTVEKLHNVWHPQIVYDVHQQGTYASRIFVPPWLDPIDPNIDPIIAQLCNAVGTNMAGDLTTAGRKGVAINAMYDFWTPARHYQSYHGGLRILSESASARLATPITVAADQISGNALGYNPRERSWNYLEPWMGGSWRIRDIMEDQEIAWTSLLYYAAVKRADMLRAFYAIGKRQSERTTPAAFVIPAEQYDPAAATELLSVLDFGQVEIKTAASSFHAGGRQYPAGTFVIDMRQPYSGFAKTLLERQDYPDERLYPGGPPKQPYDVTAQTLPLLMGVEVHAVEGPMNVRLVAPQKLAARQSGLAINGWAASNVGSWGVVNEQLAAGKRVYRDDAGNWYDSPGPGRRQFTGVRIGLYRSWNPAMDEGWTRWLLEKFGFRYESLTNQEAQRGDLRSRFDAIVFPDQPVSTIMEGYRQGSMPPEYTGGLGSSGIAALKRFAEEGGTVVFLNRSTQLAIDQLGVKARNVVRGVSNRDFYSPGSLLNVRLDSGPLTRGMPENVAIWSEGSPAWEAGDGVRVVARYPESKVLASGWLLGEKYLAGKAALLDAAYGSGHVVMFGMRPQYRAQSYQAFKMFFNALVRGR